MKPPQVQEMFEALEANAAEAGCLNTMYVEKENGIWRISCNYEQVNTMFAFDPSTETWYYQQMYGDFYDDSNLVTIGERLSQEMKGGHAEALANANCIYTG